MEWSFVEKYTFLVLILQKNIMSKCINDMPIPVSWSAILDIGKTWLFFFS